MYIELTPEQRQLQAELRQYFSTLITAEEAEAMESNRHNEAYRAVIKRMGSDGKLGVGWPKEYGGLGFGPVEQQIFVNEANRADVPLPLVTLQTVGPTLQVYGTEEQKKKFLPGILSGDIHFAIGYSEPGAGSDLASLRTTAVRDGDEYVINGSKMFTSGAEFADYVWLAARTDPDAKKHKGITLFIVPTSDPGFSWKPLHTMPGVTTYYTFYDDVRVPASSIVLGENEGWKLVTNQLNLERAALGNLGALEPLFQKTLEWARETPLDDGVVIDQPWVQQALARVEAQVSAYRLLNLRVNANMGSSALGMAEASAAKVFGTELTQQVARELLDVVGHAAVRKDEAAPLKGELEGAFRLAVINTFGGGANELQRDIIAMAGLGMPRAPRDMRAS